LAAKKKKEKRKKERNRRRKSCDFRDKNSSFGYAPKFAQ
jgi:hypothetical protein